MNLTNTYYYDVDGGLSVSSYSNITNVFFGVLNTPYDISSVEFSFDSQKYQQYTFLDDDISCLDHCIDNVTNCSFDIGRSHCYQYSNYRSYNGTLLHLLGNSRNGCSKLDMLVVKSVGGGKLMFAGNNPGYCYNSGNKNRVEVYGHNKMTMLIQTFCTSGVDINSSFISDLTSSIDSFPNYISRIIYPSFVDGGYSYSGVLISKIVHSSFTSLWRASLTASEIGFIPLFQFPFVFCNGGVTLFWLIDGIKLSSLSVLANQYIMPPISLPRSDLMNCTMLMKSVSSYVTFGHDSTYYYHTYRDALVRLYMLLAVNDSYLSCSNELRYYDYRLILYNVFNLYTSSSFYNGHVDAIVSEFKVASSLHKRSVDYLLDDDVGSDYYSLDDDGTIQTICYYCNNNYPIVIISLLSISSIVHFIYLQVKRCALGKRIAAVERHIDDYVYDECNVRRHAYYTGVRDRVIIHDVNIDDNDNDIVAANASNNGVASRVIDRDRVSRIGSRIPVSSAVVAMPSHNCI